MRVRSQLALDRPLIVGVMEFAALVEDSVHLAIFATLHGWGGCRICDHTSMAVWYISEHVCWT